MIFAVILLFNLSGDSENQIHMEGYQVSAQCMALVRDNCLVPTKDAPELGYVRESTDKQYVPDVFYKVGDAVFRYYWGEGEILLVHRFESCSKSALKSNLNNFRQVF